MRTAVDHELVDPKAKINLEKKLQNILKYFINLKPKGNKVNIP